jgi:hypothetical protein
MSAPEHEIGALTELRDRLREAAGRDVAARQPRRRRRRALFVSIALVLGGGAAAAGAATLISSGHPVKGGYALQQRYHRAGTLQIAVAARDAPLAWGVAVYRAKDGQPCAVAGQVRGATLGIVRAGTFHPYTADYPGACGRLDAKHPYFVDRLRTRDRTVVYGRVRPGAHKAVVTVDGKAFDAPAGIGGAWVLVFKGPATVQALKVG